MGSNVAQILKDLESAKETEALAKKARIDLEDELAEALSVPEDFFGSQSGTICDKKVTVTRNIYTKVDANKAMEIAEKTGNNGLLNIAFNVKYNLNKKGFKGLPEDIQKVFSDAITETPAKLSFKITDVKGE